MKVKHCEECGLTLKKCTDLAKIRILKKQVEYLSLKISSKNCNYSDLEISNIRSKIEQNIKSIKGLENESKT